MELQQWQLAYLAGLIDGEGSLESQRETQVRGRTPRYSLRLAFSLATEEPLRTIGEWIDVQPKRYPPPDERRQPLWRLHIPKGKAVPLLDACLPYLILKREQAELVLAIERVRAAHSPSRSIAMGEGRRMPAIALAQMEELHQRLRALKSAKRPAQLRI